MNAKGINKLEQHVEKIVLAVAAAGALWMGWMAIQPVDLPQNPNIPIDKVEENIARDVGRLDENRAANEKIIVSPQVRNYAREYEQLIGVDKTLPTLDKSLLATPVPPMGPTNVPVRPGDYSGVTPTYEAVTPAPVAPESVSAEAVQQPVSIAPPAPAGGATPPAPLPLVDKNAVRVDGFIPVGKMLLEMATQKDKAALPPNLQHVSIYRIEVQRRDRTGNQWSDWKDVSPAKGSPAPADIDWKNLGSDMAPTLDQVDGEFKQTVIPDFYADAQGAPITSPYVGKPEPADIQAESKKLQDDLTKAKNPNASSLVQPAEATPAATVDVASIRSQMVVPFSFWDETVDPGHRYQYQVRVVYVNPTFHFANGLKNPEMKDKPTLASAWVTIPGEVTVTSDMEFFVMGVGIGGGGGNHVEVRVFKRKGGLWYWNDFDVLPGTGIAGKITLVNLVPPPQIDVDTGYRVVDVVNVPNDTHAVLIDPAGNLVTRDASVDRTEKLEKSLFDSAQKRPTPPPATAPAQTPAGPAGPTGTTPPGGPRGRGTRGPAAGGY